MKGKYSNLVFSPREDEVVVDPLTLEYSTAGVYIVNMGKYLDNMVAIRSDGEFANKGLWLNCCYNWVIGWDSQDCLVLMASKKETKK